MNDWTKGFWFGIIVAIAGQVAVNLIFKATGIK